MFKRRRRRKSYSRKRRSKKISPWTVVVAIPLALIGLEIAARLGSGFFQTEGDNLSREAIAYSLKFVDEDQNIFQGLDNRGELLATEAISTGYELVGNQQNEFFALNEQGFRDSEPLPIAKPNGEIRVFVLGNSAAFGRGVKDNQQTVPHLLEQRLQARVERQRTSPTAYRPDVFPFFQPSREKLIDLPAKIKQGNYRVINVAVPGYSSGNELAQFALKILPYQPDLIVLVNGYEDLLLAGDNAATDIPQLTEFAKDPDAYFQKYLRQSIKGKADKSALIRAISSLVSKKENPQVGEVLSIRERNERPLTKLLPASDEEFQRRLTRYQNNIKELLGLTSAARIPLVVAIQPEITGREEDKLEPTEQRLLAELGNEYQVSVTKYYPQMIEAVKRLEKAFPTNLKLMDFYRLNDKFPTPTFLDPIHINAEAHKEMSEQLYFAIADLEKMQIIPENFSVD